MFHTIVSAKSEKSKSEPQEDAKSAITDDNNTSAAETIIPLDDDTPKSNGELSTKDGKIKNCYKCAFLHNYEIYFLIKLNY